MYDSTVSKKQRPTTGYLVRPRLGTLRSLYNSRPLSAYPADKRKKIKKSSLPKMEFRRKPDYADTAYREAVSRLRILLAESYMPIKRPLRELDSAGEETDNQSILSNGSRNSRPARSYYHYTPLTGSRRYHYYPPLRSTYSALPTDTEKIGNSTEQTKYEHPPTPNPDLMAFIERQEEYIEQLEKESTFCREELSSILNKVKDVISENENLHEKQKNKLLKSVFDQLETETETETENEFNKTILKSPKKSSQKTRIIEGPSIVFESRISELEAQLTQSKIDLRKANEENEEYKRKLADGSFLDGAGYETFKKQLEKVQREKDNLQDTVNKLQNALSKLRDKEHDTCDQVKRSLDVAEQAQYEKSAAEMEIRRLKDELERQHGKLRDAIADQSRRIADERTAVERRYTQQIEQLTAEVGIQWETTNKLQLELDKQRRENSDLRREVAQKQALVDELKKDMQNKIITLQSDIGVSGAEKSALEQQISSLQMANERTERQAKQEAVRFQAEIQSLRQRLDRADADLIHSRRENIRLNEQVASLEKEINLNAALSEERNKTPRGGEIMALPPPTPKKEDRENELSSMIQDMENKHAATVAELEGMVHSQNQLMDKLSTECHALTQKLEESSSRHKEEIRELQSNLDRLSTRFIQSQKNSAPSKGETESNNPSVSESFAPEAKLSRTNSVNSEQSQQPVTIPESYQPQPITQESYPNPEYYPEQQQYSTGDASAVFGEAPDPNYTNQDPNQQYEQYPEGTDQEYMTQEQYDQMYQGDPNQQFQGDPNQQFDPNQEYDPNIQYEVDPNAQQFTEQDPNPVEIQPQPNT